MKVSIRSHGAIQCYSNFGTHSDRYPVFSHAHTHAKFSFMYITTTYTNIHIRIHMIRVGQTCDDCKEGHGSIARLLESAIEQAVKRDEESTATTCAVCTYLNHSWLRVCVPSLCDISLAMYIRFSSPEWCVHIWTLAPAPNARCLLMDCEVLLLTGAGSYKVRSSTAAAVHVDSWVSIDLQTFPALALLLSPGVVDSSRHLFSINGMIPCIYCIRRDVV